MQPTDIKGRKFDYRDENDLVFPVNLTVPVCTHCGDIALRGKISDQFGSALEQARFERKQAAAQHFVAVVEREYPDVTRSAWEDILGLSRGYLSRILSGTRTPDAALEILLEGFARDHKAALRLVAMAGRRLPDALAHGIE